MRVAMSYIFAHPGGPGEHRLRRTVLDAADAAVLKEPGHPVQVAAVEQFGVGVDQVGDPVALSSSQTALVSLLPGRPAPTIVAD